MHSQTLKQTVSSGLLSFPITDFDENGDLRRVPIRNVWNGLHPMAHRRCLSAGEQAKDSR